MSTGDFIAESVIIVRADTKPFLEQVKAAATQAEKTKVTLTVKASMKGFRADLLKRVKSSEKGVIANIQVRPDLKGFRGTLAAEAKKTTATLINVKPDMTGFRNALVAGVESSKRGVIAHIPVRPDFKGFQKKLRAGVLSSSRGVTAPVTPTAGTGAAAAVGGAAATAKNTTKVVKKELSAQEKLEQDHTNALIENDKRRLREHAGFLKRFRSLSRRAEEASVPPVGARDEAAGLQKKAQREAAAATRLLNFSDEARRAGFHTIAEESELLARNTLDTQENTQSKVRNAEAERTTSRQRRDARRALNAQSAQLVGLRGAALSAEGAFLAAAAGLIVVTKAIEAAAQLETELNVFQATAGATADQMERVSAAARDLGADLTLPGVTAAGAATALSELSKAGLSVEDSLGAARGVLQLSSAAAIDQATAVNFVASAVNAFGLAGNEAVHVADLLAGASKESQQSMEGVGVAFQQAAAAAAQAGISLEDTIALLTGLGRAGLRGSDAGTSLRVALVKLINPTRKASEAIDSLNVNVRDSQGNIRPEIFADMSKALEGVSKAQRDATLAIIFGQDAFRAASILGKQGAAGLNSLRESTDQVGLAQQLAEARTKGFAGQLEALKNSLATLGSTVGTLVLPPLAGVLDTLTGIVGLSGDAASAIKKIVDQIPSGEEDESTFDKFRKLLQGDSGGKPSIGVGPLSNLGDILKEVRAGLALVSRGKPIELGVPATKTVEELDKKTLALIQDTDKLTAAMLKFTDATALQGPGGGAQKGIQELRDRLIGTGPAADEAKQKLDGLVRLIAALGRAPTELELELFLKEGSVDEVTQGIGDIKTFAEAPIAMSVVLAPRESVLTQTFPNRFQGFGRGTLAVKPEDIVQGDPGGEAAEKIIQGLRNKFSPNALLGISKTAFEAITSAASTAAPRFNSAGQLTAEAFMEGVRKGIVDGFTLVLRSINEQAGGLADAMNRALAAGSGPSVLLAIAQQQLDDANKIVAEADKALADPNLKKKTPERARIIARRSGALARAASARSEVESQTSAIASEREKAAKDAKDKLDKADQALLDALFPADRKLETRALIAEGTSSLQDDIAVAKAQQQNNRKQIAIINKSFNNRKEAARLIADLKDENIKLDQQIAADAQAMFEDRGAALIDLGEATGNFKLIIQGLNIQIQRAKEVVIKARAAKVGLEAAQAALAKVRQQKREMINDARDTLLETAFDLAEARGNKDLMLQIIDLRIRESKRREQQARNLSERLAAELKTQQLINERKEILEEEVEKGQEGTSAFDILQGAAETFRRTGGNIIGGNQPFAGATGFTADLAQFLRRQRSARGGGTGFSQGDLIDRTLQRRPPGAKEQEETNSLTRQLITALKALTDATLSAGGNSSTASIPDGLTKAAVDAVGQRGAAQAKYWKSVQARKVRESRGGI